MHESRLPTPYRLDEIVALTQAHFADADTIGEVEKPDGRYVAVYLAGNRAPSAAELAAWRAAVAAHTPTNTPTAHDNRRTLLQRASAAIAANQIYLEISDPTAAQVRDQVRLLTREVTALLRLAIEALDSTSGT